MDNASEPSEWSAPHDLALLYLALVHGTDLDIAATEYTTMVEKLRARYAKLSKTRAEKILQEVMLTYLGGHSREMVDAAVASIKTSMDRENRIGVLNDLAELASADGTIVPSEVSFIQQLARYWEVDREMN